MRIGDVIASNFPNPEEVQYKALWEVTVWDKKFNSVDTNKQPKVAKYKYVLASEFADLRVTGGDVKLLGTSSKDWGWTTAEVAGELVSQGEIVAIPWGGTPSVQYFSGSFVTADNRIAVVADPNQLSAKFLYYVLLSKIDEIATFYRGSGIKHPLMSAVLDLVIPIPPLKWQLEIVRILDSFTELEAELEARRKQYEHYRDQLLTFAPDQGGVRWLTLSEVCTRISSGGTPLSTDESLYGGSIPWLRTQEVRESRIMATEMWITERGLASSSARWIPPETVVVAMYGATAGRVAITGIPLTTNQACCNLEVDPDVAMSQYVFHWLKRNYAELKALGRGSQSNMNARDVKSFHIPIVPLGEQRRISAILDKFDALVDDVTIGLPAEIAARRKQYEYYRNQLLSFEEIPA